MEPLLEMFKPKYLHVPEVELSLVVSEQEVQTEQAIQPKGTPPPEQQVISQTKIETTSGTEKPFGSESMPMKLMMFSNSEVLRSTNSGEECYQILEQDSGYQVLKTLS
ncbi:unnamed protein product [Vicia faba]|uniref:Uncharacterized protein n=1 Tax=Vicia faba TaxID=3906 RepID=A0AAV1B551_VICFA|nr:unnamed protein product [Vicia faba]